jgi:hypothetical protein
MKLDGVAAVLIRLGAVAYVLKGATGLANLAWVYSKVHRAVESNPQLRQGFQESVKNGVWSGVLALAFGLVCWFVSRPVGKLLVTGLDETPAATPGA